MLVASVPDTNFVGTDDEGLPTFVLNEDYETDEDILNSISTVYFSNSEAGNLLKADLENGYTLTFR